MLKSTPDGRGTVLDSTLVVWANSMDDGRSRNPQKLPWIMAGSAGGFFKTGVCAPSAGQPVTGLLAEICNAFAVAGQPFGAPMRGLRV